MLHRYDTVDSTSERAFAALAAGGVRDGDLFVARAQTAGRGRRGRSWESSTGEGLYVSRAFLPPAPGPPAPAVTMAAGLAVLDAVAHPRARLDWPNDVVVGDAKLAGILVESRGFDPGAPRFVIGIGVNVRQRAFSAELSAERAVTSMALLGLDLTPDALLDTLAPRLDARLVQPLGELAADYLAATGLANARVHVLARDEEHVGVLRAIDLASGLVLDVEGASRTLDLAHVHAVDPHPPAP